MGGLVIAYVTRPENTPALRPSNAYYAVSYMTCGIGDYGGGRRLKNQDGGDGQLLGCYELHMDRGVRSYCLFANGIDRSEGKNRIM